MQRHTIRSKSIALLVGASALAVGCANSPTSLGRVNPRSNIVAKYSTSPNYDAIDKYSFSQAEVLYPATSGHHRISVGDYLLGEVFEALGTRSVKSLRLLSFVARCDPSGLFMPRVVCKVEYTIDLHDRERTLIEGRLEKIDIGNQVVKQDQFFLLPIVISDEFFQNKIAPVLRAATDDITNKLSVAITR